ncbi:MAG: cytochrome C class I [Azonexus sp.]|jgi:cytochrome c|nr:cytochrome C class I [Azonexus sp.]
MGKMTMMSSCSAPDSRPPQRRRYCLLGFALGIVAVASAAAQAAPFDLGRASFRTNCALCHTVTEGEPHGAGPRLHGVLGRAVASLPDFTYSAALTGIGGHWDVQRLLMFLAAPAELAPGTAMAFAGLKSERERRALVCFLSGDAQAEICR